MFIYLLKDEQKKIHYRIDRKKSSVDEQQISFFFKFSFYFNFAELHLIWKKCRKSLYIIEKAFFGGK
jgi:hypothetical protein